MLRCDLHGWASEVECPTCRILGYIAPGQIFTQAELDAAVSAAGDSEAKLRDELVGGLPAWQAWLDAPMSCGHPQRYRVGIDGKTDTEWLRLECDECLICEKETQRAELTALREGLARLVKRWHEYNGVREDFESEDTEVNNEVHRCADQLAALLNPAAASGRQNEKGQK